LTEAVAGLDLEVADGELLVVVGPSGCGKSTVLRLIAGLEEPDEGRILLGDQDLDGLPPQKRDVAMVFQGYALYPHLRVRQIVGFPLKMRRVPRRERERKVAETAEMLGLGPLLERYPAQLSGGEQQRVAMARAIVRSPRAFLFDEPLSNLDAKLRAELRVELVALLRRLGATAIYVTHDQAEAMTMGDRVAVLRQGRLQQIAAPRRIYQQPANAFVAGFVGTPAMNLIELECSGGRGRAPGLDLALPERAQGRSRLVVGIRPEHLALGEKGDDEPAMRIQAEVVSVELLGAESTLYLDADGTRLRCRMAGLDGPQVGETISVLAPEQRLMWFDHASGARL